MNIPDDILTKLICSQCNELLSTFPIYSYKNGDLVCGRCPLIFDKEPRRDVAYETLAKSLMYPCIYKSSGCMEILSPVKVREHELNCLYKQWKCPRESCKWKGLITNLEQHHLQSHLFIDDSNCFTVSMETTDLNKIVLKRICDKLFLIDLKKRDLQLFVNIYLLYKNLKYTYYHFKMTFPNETSLTLKPSGGKHLNADLYRFNITKAQSSSIGMYEISITNDLNVNTDNSKKVNEYLLEQIECPVCLEYMSTPIYQCVIGHVICNSCKLKVKHCPQCRESIGDTRNLVLEDIAENISYPCRNEGCYHICTFQAMKEHVNICQYASYKCPLKKCKFENQYSEFLQHLKEKHVAKIYENLITLDTAYKNSGSDIILKNNFIFLVTHSLMQHILNIKVTKIGPRYLPNNFLFVVTVVGDDNKQLEFRTRCLNWNAMLPHDSSRSVQLPLLKLNPYCTRPWGWSYTISIIEHVI